MGVITNKTDSSIYVFSTSPFVQFTPAVELTSDINSAPAQKWTPHSNNPTMRKAAIVRNWILCTGTSKKRKKI